MNIQFMQGNGLTAARHIKLLVCGLVAVIGLSVAQGSYASAGTVILAKGVVTATNSEQKSRVLAKGSGIEEGDVVNTGSKSFAVIRMLDNTKLTLKPDTTVAVGAFNVKEGEEEGCINLVKGGLRTVTGLIGQRKPESFNVDTPIASIGIRGTDFITRICAGKECLEDETRLSFGGTDRASEASNVAENINKNLPEGLYGSCETGTIVMSQCAGQAENFELGKCRIPQPTVCDQVQLESGSAGYSSAPVAVGGSTSSGSGKVTALSRVPDMLEKDPYFALSDLSDEELERIDRFPDNFSPEGQCIIEGGS